MSLPKKLIIVCAGGFAREVHWLASECSKEWCIAGFLDDTESLQGTTICDTPVLGKIEEWSKFTNASFVVAIGSPRHRKCIVEKMELSGKVKFATLIHPSVKYSKYVQFGEGTIVTAGCIITTQVSIARHCIINLACTVGHDVILDDFCTLAPQCIISGNVELAAGVEIGTGATIVEKIKIGTGCFIGATSIITKNSSPNCCLVGSPARHIKTMEPF